jgi:hypothetical protein
MVTNVVEGRENFEDALAIFKDLDTYVAHGRPMLPLLGIWAAYKEQLTRALGPEKAERFKRFWVRVKQRFPEGGLTDDEDDLVRRLWPEVH